MSSLERGGIIMRGELMKNVNVNPILINCNTILINVFFIIFIVFLTILAQDKIPFRTAFDFEPKNQGLRKQTIELSEISIIVISYNIF